MKIHRCPKCDRTWECQSEAVGNSCALDRDVVCNACCGGS